MLRISRCACRSRRKRMPTCKLSYAFDSWAQGSLAASIKRRLSRAIRNLHGSLAEIEFSLHCTSRCAQDRAGLSAKWYLQPASKEREAVEPGGRNAEQPQA